METFPKYQYSQFDDVNGQYVVRTDDVEEFKKLVAQVKIATNSLAKGYQTQKTGRSLASQDDKPKVPYMYEGDLCPVCNRGVLEKTIKESKAGEKYNALVCDQQGCKGFAYLSKFLKPVQISNDDIPF